MSLYHVTVPTKCFDDSVRFMHEVLEFPAIEIPAGIPMRAAWFEVGTDQHVHVLEIDETESPGGDKEFGRHVALKFPHERWLQIKSRLEQAGYEIIPPIRDSSTNRFFVHDPNGYCFEFVSG